MIKSSPAASTTVQVMFTHMLSRMPRKMTRPTRRTMPIARSFTGKSMPRPFSIVSAMAWAPVAMLVRPLIITQRPTT